MDAQQVMNIIPDHWSITAISTALQTMFKATVHQVSKVYSIIVLVLMKNNRYSFQRRMTSIERSLEEADNLSIKFQELQSSKDKIIVERNRYVGFSH